MGCLADAFSTSADPLSPAGTHPELLHLTQLIELRRTKKLELAKKWLDGLEGAYDLHQAEAEHAVWNLWAVSRVASLPRPFR